MAISATVPYGLADFSINSLKANNVSLVPGVFNYSSASSTALTVTANDIGLTSIQGLVVTGPFQVKRVDDTQWTVQGLSVLTSATGVQQIIATASGVIASTTGVPFLAWGYRR
jgi:hypothetical protein